ncbi:MAG: hypothetical protein ABID38_03250 [Candidatus Diapherotrites archaeon]
MRKRIYVFGNSLVEKDTVALMLAEEFGKIGNSGELKEFEFKVVESLDEVDEKDLKELWIMDAVKGIDEVKIIEDLGVLETNPVLSGHDFDLGLELKLWKKLGKLGKVRIIGLPSEENPEKLAEIVKNMLYKYQKP